MEPGRIFLKTCVFISLLFLLFCDVFAEETKLEFSQNLSIADGLAHNGVTSILRDSKGYMWIGTYDSLN